MFLQKSFRGNNPWYLYLFTLIVVLTAINIAGLLLAAYGLILHPEISITNPQSIQLAMKTNFGLAILLFTYLVGVLALMFCVKRIHHKQPLDILTGRSRFDMKRVLFGATIWGLLTIILLGTQYCLGDMSNLQLQFEPYNFLMMCIVLFILMPFQVGLEEIAFRGYLMQGCVLLFRYRWIAILLTGLSFGLLHGSNPEIEHFGFWMVMPQYILMGLILGLIAVMDDGIELALGLHLANNLISSIVVTTDASALQTHAIFRDIVPQASHMDTIIMLICGVIFIWACNRKYHFFSKINLWGKVEKEKIMQDRS